VATESGHYYHEHLGSVLDLDITQVLQIRIG
jgi:hypothetical protein